MISEGESMAHQNSVNLSIGAVSKITGISVHTLRAWEKRYSVVDVDRTSSGRRIYSANDVNRLRLLKSLTQAGHSIGNVARLSDGQLENMHELGMKSSGQQNPDVVNVCVYSEEALGPLQYREQFRQYFSLTQQTTAVCDLYEAISIRDRCSVLLVFNTIMKQQMRILRNVIQREPKHHYFVVYNFAQRELINEMSALGLQLIRAPITFDGILGKVLETLQHSQRDEAPHENVGIEIPEHKFTKRQLDKIASSSASNDCACKKQLVDVIQALTAFEGHSQHCASMSGSEAFVHNEMHKLTAQARSLMERAVSLVVEEDYIDVNIEA